MSKLFVVPTPIGNLKDITQRAMDVLSTVDIVLAEDTRNTGKLLKLLEIENRILAHHQNNEHDSVRGVIAMLQEGKKIAIVSDAGMPAISDPGFLLIRECIRCEIPVEVLPGPSAILPALVLSGLPCERFVFEGFLPVKKGRNTRITSLTDESRTMVFYESPHRVVKTLQQLAESFGNERKASVSREISKLHEETIRGTLFSLSEHFIENKPKGEFVLVVEGNVSSDAVRKLS